MKRTIMLHLIGIVGITVSLVLGLISLQGYIFYGLFDEMYYFFLLFVMFELMMVAYSVFHLNESTRKQLLLLGAVYLVISGGFIVALYLIEWIFGLVFLYKFSYAIYYLIIIVYPTSLWLLLFCHQILKEKILKQVVTGVFVVATFITAFMHLLLLMLGGQSTTHVDFDNPNRELVLVESTFIFSSTHTLYEQVNPLFVTTVYSNGSWTCNDGCVTQNPEAYDWVWIDENTLEVSNDAMFGTVVFYFGD